MAAIGPNHIKELPIELETKCITSLVARGIEVHKILVPKDMTSAEVRAFASEMANAASVCKSWRVIAQPVLNRLKMIYDRKLHEELLSLQRTFPPGINQLTEFTLPDTLQTLPLYNNQLTEFTLPDTLQELLNLGQE